MKNYKEVAANLEKPHGKKDNKAFSEVRDAEKKVKSLEQNMKNSLLDKTNENPPKEILL